MAWDREMGLSHEHICFHNYLLKVTKEGLKEGREGGPKKREKEGKKERRKEGRKNGRKEILECLLD
jgi:hypothetical protein